jgi:hypothetical protein
MHVVTTFTRTPSSAVLVSLTTHERYELPEMGEGIVLGRDVPLV